MSTSPNLPTGGSPAAERGFTVLELLVVMLLVGLVMMIGIPNVLRAKIRAEMLGQVKMVRQAVAVSRMAAIKEGQRVALSFENLGTSGGMLFAWVDENGDQIQDAGERVINRWRVHSNFSVAQDAGTPFLKLNNSSSRRGAVFMPTGQAITGEAALVGTGSGAAIIADRRGNEFRLEIFAGAGTVEERMKTKSGDWDKTSRSDWKY